MSSRAFFDTNVLIYAALQPDPRSEAARGLLAQRGVISVQVLNEFASVARRKLRRSWPEIARALAAIRTSARRRGRSPWQRTRQPSELPSGADTSFTTR